MTLPRAARPFFEFPALLRAHGFAVATDQTIGFLAAIALLGPRHVDDIRRAALAMLAIPHPREPEFDALFRAFFLGQTVAAAAESRDDDAVDAYEPKSGDTEALAADDEADAGAEASAVERLSQRRFSPRDGDAALALFARAAPGRLPRRLSYRRVGARRGAALDMRRTLREAVRRDGEVVVLKRLRRKTRQRRVVLLIDVSGSMKERSDDSLRFAHALARAADHAEIFTLGTRLTRVTPALAMKDRTLALARVGLIVADFDGGTRIGEALQAYLAVPRFAGHARGASVVVVSDGLERGGYEAMVDAVVRLKRIAWRVDWLSPLAGDPAFSPRTGALAELSSHLGGIGDGSDLAAICAQVLNLARAA